MRVLTIVTLAIMPIALSGCVASKIITAPFKVAGTVVETAVDATTQTQSEREEDAGRKLLAKYDACMDEADNRKEREECRDRYDIDD